MVGVCVDILSNLRGSVVGVVVSLALRFGGDAFVDVFLCGVSFNPCGFD